MIWDYLQHFSRDEAWGDPERMSHDFLRLLDLYRGRVGEAVHVTCGFDTSGHVSDSMHYKGRAVDGRFVDSSGAALSFVDQLSLAMRSPFTGIGIYTWSPNGTFLHLDNRDLEGERKVWACEVKGVYQPLSEAFLKRHIG